MIKASNFTDTEISLAKLSKALAHPARIAILNLLASKESCVCGNIVDELPLSQSTVSQHLKELKTAGLIKGTIDGPKVCYCIDQDNWTQLKKEFKNFFDSIEIGILNNCC